MRPRARAASWVLVALATLAACVPEGLAFREDDRLSILSPEHRSSVVLPVSIAWEVRDFEGTFAVFVDRAPQPPGQPVSWVARNDEGCRVADGCPDTAYLNGLGVYPTADTELVLERIPMRSGGDRRRRHSVNIVLIDADGRRSGESAFYVEFEVERSSP